MEEAPEFDGVGDVIPASREVTPSIESSAKIESTGKE